MEAEGGSRLGWRGCCDWADADENKGNGLGQEKGFMAKIIKRFEWLQKCLLNWFKDLISKLKGLNIFKLNLNCIQNRIKSNQLLENFQN
jgi:hypothetical protein